MSCYTYCIFETLDSLCSGLLNVTLIPTKLVCLLHPSSTQRSVLCHQSIHSISIADLNRLHFVQKIILKSFQFFFLSE